MLDRARLQGYAAGYERRRAAHRAEIRAEAEAARTRVPPLAEICRRYGARRVRLFGSLVTHRFGESPDIDLAVEGLPPNHFFDLLAELQDTRLPCRRWAVCSCRARVLAA
jgi:predicted nucleotidyltransferase